MTRRTAVDGTGRTEPLDAPPRPRGMTLRRAAATTWRSCWPQPCPAAPSPPDPLHRASNRPQRRCPTTPPHWSCRWSSWAAPRRRRRQAGGSPSPPCTPTDASPPRARCRHPSAVRVAEPAGARHRSRRRAGDRRPCAGRGRSRDDGPGHAAIADAPSTGSTVVTATGTHVREVYALYETAPYDTGPHDAPPEGSGALSDA